MSETPTVRFYDMANDELRAVTQADVDKWELIAEAFGRWRWANEALRKVTLEIVDGKCKPFDIAKAIRDARPRT